MELVMFPVLPSNGMHAAQSVAFGHHGGPDALVHGFREININVRRHRFVLLNFAYV
jgi:hypothetical protein